jgi:imidazolonepropionase-like amidohydrolase
MMSVQAGVDTIEHGSRITDMEALSLMAERGISVVYTAGIVWGHPEIKDVAPKATEAALAAGVNIALGADCNHGIFGFEAECAVANGMPAERALIAMTSASARACAVDDELGSLAAGKLADVVVVRGNPVEDIKNLNDVLLVMKDGLTVNRPALAAA